MSPDSTRLFVYNQAAEYYEDDSVGPKIDDAEVLVVKKIFEENNFHISETSYDSTIISDIFVTTAENLNRVDTVEEALKDHYPEREIDRSKHYSDQAPSSEGLPYVIGITIKPTEKEKEDRHARSQDLQDRLQRKKNNLDNSETERWDSTVESTKKQPDSPDEQVGNTMEKRD